MTTEKLYTVKEVSVKLGVSIPTARKYIKLGHLKAIPLPGSYRIPESALDKLLQVKG
ncbi:hypothetical protein LCGC14_1741050 [marine sediment metagenome]|uniref:Helix-turn-helix domain-containing protein n=1 Tax=marine sediment metagenome TaxID=412755 RepID=A0A0F9HU97_9ZZZZ